jgi:SAM-dependent methyltransferase
MFDVITCASAFVLLADPGSAVKSWAKLLKKGGRLIFDVPTNDSTIRGLMLDKVAQELGIPVVYGRTTLDSKEKVIQLLTDAGMDSPESFLSGDYEEPSEVLGTDGEKAGEVWDAMVAQQSWFTSWYMGLIEPGVEKTAKEVFCREEKKIAGPDGKVRKQIRFHMAVGRKV